MPTRASSRGGRRRLRGEHRPVLAAAGRDRLRRRRCPHPPGRTGDRDGSLAGDPAAFWAGGEFPRAWARHAGIAKSDAHLAWAIVDELDGRDDSVWRIVDPSADEVLSELEALGLGCAAVSNAKGRLAEDLDRAGLAGHFDVVLDSELVGVSKPDPRIYAMAAAELALDCRACWYVGDQRYELRGALEARYGAAFHLDALGAYPPDDRVVTIRELAELPRFARVSAAGART
jgi:HAD superfamily hydrolase (TIGR01509 family)